MTHIRRCHICSEISESENSKIERCENCGKYLAPFVFCNDPSDSLDYNALRKATTQTSSKPGSFLKQEYPPIYGISLYW